MARGQLGNDIQAHFSAHPEAQTIREIKDALKATSAGAIGYALDRLINQGKLVKLEGRPARYRPANTTGKIVDVGTAQGYPGPEDEEEVKPSKGKRTSRCGYCDPGKPVQFHQDHCPRMIPRAQAGADWYCSCADRDHHLAKDYAEYRAEMEADATERAARQEKKGEET